MSSSPIFVSVNSTDCSAVMYQIIMMFQLAMDSICDSGFTEGLVLTVSRLQQKPYRV